MDKKVEAEVGEAKRMAVDDKLGAGRGKRFVPHLTEFPGPLLSPGRGWPWGELSARDVICRSAERDTPTAGGRELQENGGESNGNEGAWGIFTAFWLVGWLVRT